MKDDLEVVRLLLLAAGALASKHVAPEPAPNLNGGLRWCLEEAGRLVQLNGGRLS